MALEPWYKVVTPRKEVREGRSFNPDEFAIHLEQVVGGTAPEDYRDPEQFFARTSFTRALREHAGMVLRRLAGETANTAPAMALEDRAFFVRKVGSDGFKISHTPTMKKVVSDRRASLDEEKEIQPALRELVKREFDKGAHIPRVFFPADSLDIPDSPRLTLVVADPSWEWEEDGPTRARIAEWTRRRGRGNRLYPGSLVWVVRRPGRSLHDRVTHWLAWKRVATEVAQGTLGGDFDPADRAEIKSKVADAEEAARDEVWAGYIHVALHSGEEGAGGLETINLGAGHASSSDSLCGRVISALKSGALLNESVGAGYLERNWPPALKESGAWPLSSLRQSFLNGALTRLVDPDTVLRNKIAEFVGKGDFGLASGEKADGTYERVWFEEPVSSDEISFEPGVFLLLRDTASRLKTKPESASQPVLPPEPRPGVPAVTRRGPVPGPGADDGPDRPVVMQTIRVHGEVPPEMWNRLGTKLLPKLKSGQHLRVRIDLAVSAEGAAAEALKADLEQILRDLGLNGTVLVRGE